MRKSRKNSFNQNLKLIHLCGHKDFTVSGPQEDIELKFDGLTDKLGLIYSERGKMRLSWDETGQIALLKDRFQYTAFAIPPDDYTKQTEDEVLNVIELLKEEEPI